MHTNGHGNGSIFPRMLAVRQKFPSSTPLAVKASVQSEMAALRARVRPGMRVAVAVGSRGITNLKEIVSTVLQELKAAGAQPFIIPAMGSHGGATPEGQAELLGEYGVSEATMGVPIRAAMEVDCVGTTDDGVDVFCSVEAMKADGVVLINRIKPHTDFSGNIGSGVCKIMVIGLGKRIGAANYHANACKLGYEHTLRTIARVLLKRAPILGGIAIVENQFHETARIAALLPETLEERENELFQEAKRLMPRLPFEDIDLLIVDRIGKNISGSGMDPNVIGRWVHGYSSMLGNRDASPVIRRIFVRGLTPETHGNAIGIGLADITTTRLVKEINYPVMHINCLTSLTPNCAKVPIHFDTDREAIQQALISLAMKYPRQAKVVRIADTLSLEHLEVSESWRAVMQGRGDLSELNDPTEMGFDATGNLISKV
jgi:hypothetical protein